MKARIIVTLMIALSMCIGAAVALSNPCEEGYNDGDNNGYSDARDGLDRDHLRDLNNPYQDDASIIEYKQGYRNGYNDGYDDGCSNDIDLIPAPIDSGPVTIDEPENCMSSPSMGIGLKLPDGTVTQRGDQVPTLYTWAEVNDKYEHHTTLYHPLEGTFTGCVIITPPQIAGEPLVESNFWTSAKGLRILQWKANAG